VGRDVHGAKSPDTMASMVWSVIGLVDGLQIDGNVCLDGTHSSWKRVRSGKYE